MSNMDNLPPLGFGGELENEDESPPPGFQSVWQSMADDGL
jgi:hypothetical protein